VLEVRESNSAAIRLYEKHCFRLVGRRKDYYCGPSEDARVYEFDFRGDAPGS
jgi:ribosomal-protein-alanine N-acetyltransferase